VPPNLNRFDLVTLRLFVAAVHQGSLTAGAVQLGVSLAAASKRIAELEHHVGTPLLERSKRGVCPTPAGQTLLPHALEMVARLAQLALAMGDVRSGTAGHLRLWANTSAFGGFLPELLAAFSSAHPRVVLDLEDAISEDAVRGVARGAAELAVIGENTPTEGLHTEVCHIDELVLLLPPGHPLVPSGNPLVPSGNRQVPSANALPSGKPLGPAGSPLVPAPQRGAVELADLLAYDLVAFSRPTSLTRQLAAAAEALQRPLRIRAQVRSFDAMSRMVAAGLGLAVLPRMGALPYARALGLVVAPLRGMRTERCLLWAMRDRARLSEPARALIELAEARR